MLQRIFLLALALLTVAAIHSVERRSSTEVAPSRPIGGAGLRVVIDPATGEIVDQPTADQIRGVAGSALRQRRRVADLRRFDLPNAAEGVALDGWAHHATRVERGEDGALRVVCTQGDAHGGER